MWGSDKEIVVLSCLTHCSSAQSDGETEEEASIPIGIDDLESTPIVLPMPSSDSFLVPRPRVLQPAISGKVSCVFSTVLLEK